MTADELHQRMWTALQTQDDVTVEHLGFTFRAYYVNAFTPRVFDGVTCRWLQTHFHGPGWKLSMNERIAPPVTSEGLHKKLTYFHSVMQREMEASVLKEMQA